MDTTTPTGRARWQMVEILAELERSLIQERTQAGRAAAQARGVQTRRLFLQAMVRRWLDGICGTLFVGFGVRFALQRQ